MQYCKMCPSHPLWSEYRAQYVHDWYICLLESSFGCPFDITETTFLWGESTELRARGVSE